MSKDLSIIRLNKIVEKLCVIGIACLTLLGSASPTAGQKRPNFSGRWELDTTKSQLRPRTKWNGLVMVVEHQEPKLKINLARRYPAGNESTSQLLLTTDGREISVREEKGTRIYRAVWTGSKLEVKWGQERTETWTLSQDGKTLTMDCFSNSAKGPPETWKNVMVKK